MFLSDKPCDIQDFLKAVKFIAPEGTNLKYFVIPVSDKDGNMAGLNNFNSMANQAGYTADEIKKKDNEVPGVTDTIVYSKRELKDRISQSSPTYDIMQSPEPFPITHPTEPDSTANNELDIQFYGSEDNKNPQDSNQTPMSTDILVTGGQILPKVHGLKVLESCSFYTDLILKEAYSVFPKNTLFHFVKERV